MTERDTDLAFHGTWVQPAPRRVLGQVILVLATTGAVGGLGLLLWHQTFDALAVLVGFTVIALLTYLALSASSPTTVTLSGPRLVVRCGRDTDEFDLRGPIRRIQSIGFPNRPNWRIRLEANDGKIVELGPTQIDPALVHAAVSHYRTPTIPQQRTSPEDSLPRSTAADLDQRRD